MLYTNEPQITSGTRLQSNYDLNKANTSGWYTVSTPKNGVSGLNAEKLFVIAPKNKNYITQFAFGDNDNLESMWFRSCANGTWSEWKEVATTDLYLAIAGGTITGDLTVKGNINGKFTGTPTTPNATGSSSDQQIANLKYVNDSIAKLVDYSPTALDTLKELADAIGNDPNFAATMTSKLSEKFDKVGGQISGDVNVTGKITGHLVGNADTATRAVTAATADKTQASISFKNPDGSNTSFNGNTAVDMTGGVYYAKESSHTVNADEATHAASATTVSTTAPTGQTKDLVSAGMANNDFFRILVGDTGDNNGYVSFDTADDGTEPIYFRQYTGVFASVAHQITLLDGNGNTSFPGTIWAPTFSGHLVGNADHATNASHADKADNALYASVANHTDNSISFKNINGSNVSFNGAGAVDLTGGVYYAKESSHTINADSAGTAGTCTGNSATATSAAKLGRDGVPGNPMTFNWSGQSGQPSWLWGGNDGTNMYVWNPSNFSVAHAVNADNATHAGTADNATNASHASNADNATNAGHVDNDSAHMRLHWAGQAGQPTWLWGSNDSANAYLYNPVNFSVAHASNADNATHAVQDKNGADIAGTYFPKSGGTISGNVTVPTIYSNNWFRSSGDTGWYNETHQGGWYMTDNDWVRSYNGKNVYTSSKMQADGGFYGALHGTADNATNATNATNASHAVNADNATHAGTANNATNASHAGTADSAGNSNQLGGSTLAQVLEQAKANGNVTQEKHIVLRLIGDLTLYYHATSSANGNAPGTQYDTSTTGNVEALILNKVIVYSTGPYTKIELATVSIPTGSKTNTALGTSFTNNYTSTSHEYIDPNSYTDGQLQQQVINYIKQHLDEFKSKIAQTIPEAAQATEIDVDAKIVSVTR